MGAPTWPNGFDDDQINLYMALRDAGALMRVGIDERGDQSEWPRPAPTLR
jgi:hypothetical protein